MISKDDVLKNFNKEEKDEVLKIYQCMELAYFKGISVYTKSFCRPNIWLYFINNFNSKTLSVEADGYFNDSDRRVLCFNNIYDEPYPYVAIKIVNKSKFSNLKHKDYLGGIMSLGIKREKFGDLIVKNEYAIVPVYEDIAQYIIDCLTVVGKSPVECNISNDSELMKVDFLEEVINVSSLRLDNFVAKLSNKSRAKAIDLISENKVLIDYCKVDNKSEELKEGQRITISGVGKFIIGTVIGSTKSGKYKVAIKKYI